MGAVEMTDAVFVAPTVAPLAENGAIEKTLTLKSIFVGDETQFHKNTYL